MKKTDIILLTGLFASIAFTNFVDFGHNVYDIERSVLRMHILANSDSDDDQKLKRDVRDELLKHSEELFGGCGSLDEMKRKANEKKDEINDIALDVIRKKGYDYNVSTNVVNMDFDERQYGDITMPAGKYDALRVTIGEAKGHNWWCVMYPPLCIPCADEVSDDDKTERETFSEKQLDIMEKPEKYRVKFKCARWFRKIASWF